MGMGIVDDKEFEHELNRTLPSDVDIKKVDGKVIELEHPGRKDGDKNVPDALRKIIGEHQHQATRTDALELASKFGISPSSVSAYANGSTSTSTYDKQPNKSFIDDGKSRIQKRARKILFQSLHHITPEKLADEKPIALAMIAKQMSGIVKEMEPESDAVNRPLAQFVIMCPSVKSENDYEIMTAREG